MVILARSTTRDVAAALNREAYNIAPLLLNTCHQATLGLVQIDNWLGLLFRLGLCCGLILYLGLCLGVGLRYIVTLWLVLWFCFRLVNGVGVENWVCICRNICRRGILCNRFWLCCWLP